MLTEQEQQVVEYLRTWTDEDWDDVWHYMAIMKLPEALVAVHRNKRMRSGLPANPEPSPSEIPSEQMEMAM